MKILILHPGGMPTGPEKISCFTDVWAYYLPNELKKHIDTDVIQIPGRLTDNALAKWFDDLDIKNYRAVIALGLRYFSSVPKSIGEKLRERMSPHGFLCQIHDGSRLDNDPVDINFTLKDESDRYPFDAEANRYVRHHSYNAYIGWAADSDINRPDQDNNVLRILVDHTNYGPNPVDRTKDILLDIREFAKSLAWKKRWGDIQVRRFDSGRVVDVDLDNIGEIERYDRTAIPFTDICREHGQAHVFCVTHPESVGQVVLETAMAGALTVTPKGFIPIDRLATVRHLEYEGAINWNLVLSNINPGLSRKVALENSWSRVARRIRSEIWIRSNIRRLDD